MEIDIFAVDGDVAVAIEVKSRLSQRDVFEYIFNNLKARPYLHFESAFRICIPTHSKT